MSDARNASLDLMRGLAALAVCVGHLRAFLFVDWGDLKQRTLLDAGFYLLTGYSHPSVMAFFVLSGYLVGGSTFKLWRQDRWTWQNFLVQRMVRLQIVLIPALIMTAAFDFAGMRITQGTGYDGAYNRILAMAPSVENPVSLAPDTFLGNLLFLQTIVTPWFGTNGPLWSLANEFWYYLIFPLLLGVWKGRAPYRIACLAALGIAFGSLPFPLLMLGLIWLYGVLVAVLEQMPRVRSVAHHPAYFAITLAWVAAALVGYKYWIVWLGNDWSIGAAFAAFVLALTRDRIKSAALRKFAMRLADMSYTLYLFHFPLMAFLWFCWLAPRQYVPSPQGYTMFAGFLFTSLAYAYAMWWLFERRTDDLRKAISSRLVHLQQPVLIGKKTVG